MNRTARQSGAKGFTLVELMLVVVVLGIIASAAGPSLVQLIASNRAYAVQLDLAASFALARTEAARRNANVVVSATAPVTNNELGGGWVVWADLNGNGNRDDDEPVVRTREALPSQVVVSGPATVTYAPSGFVVPAAARRYTVCGTRATHLYAVTVQPNGLADLTSEPPCS